MKQLQAERLDAYAELIERYHETLDLMSSNAVREIRNKIAEATLYARMLEALSPTPVSILDLGAGVGLPGVPIAAALPGCNLLLVERRRRRAAFLRIVVSQLDLVNAAVVEDDVRALHGPCVDAVVAQGVGSFGEVYGLSRHLQGEQVWLVSRKGPDWQAELEQLQAQQGLAAAEVREERLPTHGSLVGVLLPGGSACPPSG